MPRKIRSFYAHLMFSGAIARPSERGPHLSSPLRVIVPGTDLKPFRRRTTGVLTMAKRKTILAID